MNDTVRKWVPLAILILVLVTASGMLLRGNTGSDKKETAQVQESDKQSPKAVETPRPGDRPLTDRTAAASPGEDPRSADERSQLLETVGSLTAALCYQTYLNIGLLADGRAKGTYTDKDAAKVLDSILSFLDRIDRKLAALEKMDLDRVDRESLEQMRTLSDLLHQQGRELQSFWETGKDEDAARYENTRKDSWAAISRLLGIGR
jgi:cob(I)alamin adenosyltransferase